MQQIPMIIELTVVKVGFGGNASHGRYFYSYQDDVILVRQPGTTMEFRLSQHTPKNFKIKSMISSDSSAQLIEIKRSSDDRAVNLVNKCLASELISLAIIVRDEEDQSLIVCDPQVLNEPDLPANAA